MEVTPTNVGKIFKLPLKESPSALFTNFWQFRQVPILLTHIWDVIFQHLDMAVLYDPNAKTAIVYYVLCRTIDRRQSGVANGRFFRVTQNPEALFSEYYTTVLNKFFEFGILHNKESDSGPLVLRLDFSCWFVSESHT